jgi:DNA-binding CsgD family transcriptional regulator
VFEFINKLGKESSVKGHYFLARYNTVKAQMIRWFNPPEPASSTFVRDSIKRKVTSLLDVALQQAYIADDDYLAAYVSSIYGNAMSGFGNTEKAVMYLMNSAELYDKVHLHAQVAAYILLGETLWRVREYEKSIYYTKIAIRLMTSPEDKQHKLDTSSIMMCNNTIGLAYQRLGLNDSASFYYARSLQLLSSLSDEKGKETWKGIISGNIAQIDFAQGKYLTALPLFMMDYQTSNGYGFFDEAADAIQWAAKTNLALGNKSAALAQVRESLSLLKKWPNAANYRQHAYLTASEIFKSIGDDDSAYYYSGKYNVLHDSLEKVIYQSSISISQLRLNNEKNRYNIRNLEVVKNDQIQKRNYIIAVIAIVSVFILLIVNRQRQKSKYRLQLEHAEKIRIEVEMEAAKMQMKMFTQSIIEKTSLIEKLESQVPKENSSRENQQLIDDLSHQTILTEEDWLNFKILFEKMYPSFFEKIINQVNNITQAEQRMASLTLLHLTTKQMAAILGISSNSVIKAKQRLRQRLDLLTDQEVEEFMAKL